MICSPSFLSCDFNQLASEIKSINRAKWLHFDVMDGEFVANTTYDESVLKEISDYSSQFFDCHLMIVEPEKHYRKYIEAGADLVTFHLEASDQPLKLLKAIRQEKCLAGISIKPKTNVEMLAPLLPFVDLILIMSVEPGQGGQKFLDNAIDKIEYLNTKRKIHDYKYLIEVDGGINFETAKKVKNAGCDVIVVGSFLFNSNQRNALIEALENV